MTAPFDPARLVPMIAVTATDDAGTTRVFYPRAGDGLKLAYHWIDNWLRRPAAQTMQRVTVTIEVINPAGKPPEPRT